MNRQEVINRIREIFGYQKSSFGMYKNTDGAEFRIEELQLEADVYLITPEGEIPVPDGMIELEDGTKVTMKEGKISDLKMMENKMSEATLLDGTIVENDSDEMKVGDELFVKTEEGRQPALDGLHETDGGLLIETKDGIITSIEEKSTEPEQEVVEASKVEMTEAMTPEGVKLESPTFDVGEKVEVVGEDGSMTPASDGEHQVTLKDTEGNEVKIRFITKDGIIVERSNVEGDSADLASEMMSTILEAFESIKNDLAELKKENETLKEKFSKFSAEPATTKVYDRKGYVEEMETMKFSKLEALSQLKNNKIKIK